ncbi:Hypothetical predicted protein [Xyrichtys novacula]|uniref:Uncharacterized protein n=1 Tax=Xyrichtys novacula TaxID=13765 RepID=A0AAV1HMQ9_XYRNO|nr:Hypothetical predicted protein [Xyrichtys novacula]
MKPIEVDNKIVVSESVIYSDSASHSPPFGGVDGFSFVWDKTHRDGSLNNNSWPQSLPGIGLSQTWALVCNFDLCECVEVEKVLEAWLTTHLEAYRSLKIHNLKLRSAPWAVILSP